MGADYSKPVTYHPEVPIFCVYFSRDSLYLVNADHNIQGTFRKLYTEKYPKGIKEENIQGAMHKVKMNGWPFSSYTQIDFGCSINIMCELLKELSSEGYILLFSGGFQRHDAWNTWFFYKSPLAVANNLEFCAIDLYGFDKIRFSRFKSRMCEDLRRVVEQNWPEIQNIFHDEDGYEIKLKGYPWKNQPNSEESIAARKLLLKFLQVMGSHGFTLFTSTNIDEKTDTMFFCKKSDLVIPDTITTTMMAITLERGDLIRLINANDEAVQIVRRVLRQSWPELQNDHGFKSAWEFKLKGSPWSQRNTSFEKTQPIYMMLCHLFRQLRAAGWRIVTNSDVTVGDQDKGVFFFVKFPPKDAQYAVVSFRFPSELFCVNMFSAAINLIASTLSRFYMFKSSTPAIGGHKFAFESNPFFGYPIASWKFATSQSAIAAIVNALVSCNYHIQCAANVCCGHTTESNGSTETIREFDILILALDDPPMNVGLFTDMPAFPPPPYFSPSAIEAPQR